MTKSNNQIGFEIIDYINNETINLGATFEVSEDNTHILIKYYSKFTGEVYTKRINTEDYRSLSDSLKISYKELIVEEIVARIGYETYRKYKDDTIGVN